MNLQDAVSIVQRPPSLAELDQAIELLRGLAADDPEIEAYLGIALHVRFHLSDDVADLRESISIGQAGNTRLGADYPALSGHFRELSNRWNNLFEATGDFSALDESIAAARRSVSVARSEQDRMDSGGWFGERLLFRFHIHERPTDVREAVDVLREVADAVAPEQAEYGSCHHDLSSALTKLFGFTEDPAQLSEAIAVAERALERLPGTSPVVPVLHNAAGDALQTRFLRFEALSDVDAAISHIRAAIALVAREDVNWAAYRINLGNSLRARYQRSGIPEELDESIALFEEALTNRAAETPYDAQVLHKQGLGLRLRFESRGAIGDLDAAIDCFRAANRTAAPGHPGQAHYRYTLCTCLVIRFEHTGNRADIDEAMPIALDLAEGSDQVEPLYVVQAAGAVWKRSTATQDPSDREHAITVLQTMYVRRPMARVAHWLADLVFARYRDRQHAQDLQETIELSRTAGDLAERTDPELVNYLMLLGTALLTRYSNQGMISDVEETITAMRRALELAPAEHPSVLWNRHVLAEALWRRFLRTGNRIHLDESIQLRREVLALNERWAIADAAATVDGLAQAIQHRYDLFADPADLAELEELLGEPVDWVEAFERRLSPGQGEIWGIRRALQAADVMNEAADYGRTEALDLAILLMRLALPVLGEHEAVGETLANLAAALYNRFTRIQVLADLTEAIQLARQAAVTDPTTHAQLAGHLRVLFEHTGEIATLEEALEIARAAHAHDPANADVLQQILYSRFRRLEHPKDLDEAIVIARQAADLGAAGAEAGLSTALLARHELAGHAEDLRSAIVHARAAMDAAQRHPATQQAAWTALGAALRARYLALGDPGDLDESLDLDSRAEDAQRGRISDETHITNMMLTRLRAFIGSGDPTDLAEAHSLASKSLGATPPGHPDRQRVLFEYCKQRRVEYGYTADRACLAEAVAAAEEWLSSLSETDHRRPECLRILCDLLSTDAQGAGARANLDRAVELARQIQGILPADRDRLSSALLARFRLTRSLSDIEEATGIGRELLAGDRNNATSHLRLARCLLARHDVSDAESDLDEAIEFIRSAIADHTPQDPTWVTELITLAEALRAKQNTAELLDTLEQVLQAPLARPFDRLWAGQQLGMAAGRYQQWSRALRGYSSAVSALGEALWRTPTSSGREQLLAQWTGLAWEAAACAIEAGDADHAVQLMEQGRALLWGQNLDFRTDLTELRGVAPRLASELHALRADWERTGDQRLDQLVRWQRLVEQARTQAGAEDFLQPLTTDRLRAAAIDGPIVFVNLSSWRCDALILTENTTIPVELPQLTLPEAMDRANSYLQALLNASSGQSEAQLTAVITELALTSTLEWLWDRIAEPVMTELNYDRNPQTWPRLWWCPTGPLTVLPLHAAGYHDDPETGGVLDRAVSSYTPAIRSLLRARTPHPRTTSAVADRRLLLVACETTPGLPDLPGVQREVQILTELLPAPRHTLYANENAVGTTIHTGLEQHAWAHFSCHGQQQLDDPRQGGLWLHDGLLTIGELTTRRHLGEFAFLSACKTAVGGSLLPDESITLASALQFAGWRHVIGTLWSVGDQSAADITERMYQQLIRDGELRPDEAALALHHAVSSLRDREALRPTSWALFIHSGP